MMNDAVDLFLTQILNTPPNFFPLNSASSFHSSDDTTNHHSSQQQQKPEQNDIEKNYKLSSVPCCNTSPTGMGGGGGGDGFGDNNISSTPTIPMNNNCSAGTTGYNSNTTNNNINKKNNSRHDVVKETATTTNFSTLHVPDGCGMMFELRNTSQEQHPQQPNNSNPKNGGCCKMKSTNQVLLHIAVPDQRYPKIHSNCHAPADLQDVRLLLGGGSGTAVFHGESTTLGSIVMKHGGPKDAKEVFSLITIRQELDQRVVLQQQVLKMEANAAAERMRNKIPEFVMVYISPYHLRDRYQELWATIRFNPETPELYARQSYLGRTMSSFQLDQYDRNPLQQQQQQTKKPDDTKVQQFHILSSHTEPLNDLIGNEQTSNCTISTPQPPPVPICSSERIPRTTMETLLRKSSSMPLDDDDSYKRRPTKRITRFSRRLSITEKEKIHRSEKLAKRRIHIRYPSAMTDQVVGEGESLSCSSNNKKCEPWVVSSNDVDVMIQSKLIPLSNNNTTTTTSNMTCTTDPPTTFIVDDGIDGLQRITKCIFEELLDHQWKITIGQKTIGGPNAENGAHVLTSGKLRCKLLQQQQQHGKENVVTRSYNDLLQKLVNEFCQVMEDLSTLTYSHERRGQRLTNILRGVQDMHDQYIYGTGRNHKDYDSDLIYHVTDEMDRYVGSAIRKNFEPVTGRFAKLRQFALDLNHESYLWDDAIQPTATCGLSLEEEEAISNASTSMSNISGSSSLSHNWILTKKEEIPARFISMLLYQSDHYDPFDNTKNNSNYKENYNGGIWNVFMNPPSERSALDEVEDRGWYGLLLHATSFVNDTSISSEARAAATDCIWTCGLTDAGLHNTFVHAERGLELFDLGTPHLEPQPAFLTKFLMSFFHTLGMEEDESSNKDTTTTAAGSTWVQRFRVVTVNGREMLDITDKTKEMIPYIHNAFTFTLDHFIQNTFYGNDRVRSLLIKYVILQLLSDSSFCINRWEEKGGGIERYGTKLQDPLEKWLWRCLWDQYIACYVYTNLLLPAENRDHQNSRRQTV